MQGTLIEQVKFQLKNGGMTIRLIAINLAIYLSVGIIFSLYQLTAPNVSMDNAFLPFLRNIFSMDGDLIGFLWKPWGLITHMFTHYELSHFLFNMLALYFSGQFFLKHFSNKKLLSVYILGGIFGGLLHLIAHTIFPLFINNQSGIVGASGAIMAVMVAIGFYKPNEKVLLFGVVSIPLIAIPGFYILSDLMNMYRLDGIAHFGHLGGAVLGFIFVQTLNKKNNIVSLFENFLDRFFNFIQGKKTFSSKLKVEKSEKTPKMTKSEKEMEEKKKQNQAETDLILSKISKGGYNSLTESEKEFLFSHTKKS